jgi:hypothetical protein
MRFYVTFPQKNEQLKDSYSIVTADSEESAREKVVARYKSSWAFIYTEEGWNLTGGVTQAQKYGLNLHERFA